MYFLITAGGTREYIDPVRFISNASSGKMGYALALAAIKAGHKVTLITTVKNSEFRIQNSELKVVNVETAKEMFVAVKKIFSRCDCLIMAAAVSDYTPIKKSKIKIQKSNKTLIIKLKPTADILNWVGKHKRKNQIVVGFALGDKNLRQNAEKKLKEKNLDMIVANSLSAIGSEQTQIHYKISGSEWVKLPSASKQSIANKLIKVIEKLF
jgi:phosphopantothenoylcysteine synthetase/decarboxylase